MDTANPLSISDYRRISPKWSTYVSVGDLSLFFEKHQLVIGGNDLRGGWISYGPLAPGKYKLRCTFMTHTRTFDEPSNLAKEYRYEEELWLGQFTSAWIDIEIKNNGTNAAPVRTQSQSKPAKGRSMGVTSSRRVAQIAGDLQSMGRNYRN